MDLGTPGSPGVAKLRFLDPTCVGRSTIAQWLQLLWKVPDFRARTRDRWIALRRGAWSNAGECHRCQRHRAMRESDWRPDVWQKGLKRDAHR